MSKLITILEHTDVASSEKMKKMVLHVSMLERYYEDLFTDLCLREGFSRREVAEIFMNFVSRQLTEMILNNNANKEMLLAILDESIESHCQKFAEETLKRAGINTEEDGGD